MKELKVGNKMMVEIPRRLREMQPGHPNCTGSEEFYTELATWINTFEDAALHNLQFLCIDYYGVCWFKIIEDIY